MSQVSALRRWLRRSPQPVKLRVDGRELAVATGANQWAITEESVVAMSPSRVEALDAKGELLRATTLERADEDDASSTVDKKPRGPEDRFNQFARLLNEAHDNGAKRHGDAYKLAFEELVRLVGQSLERLGSMEAAWSKAIHASAKAQAEAAVAAHALQTSVADGGDPVTASLMTMLGTAAAQGVLNGNGAPKTNGAPKPKPKD